MVGALSQFTGLSVELLLAFGGAVLIAGVVRGFTGFGFSALTVAIMFFVIPVSLIVPVVYTLEVAASVQMLKSVWRQIDWKLFLWIAAGCLAGAPVGQRLLMALDAEQARTMASIIVLALVALTAAGLRVRLNNYAGYYLFVGLSGGIINGAVGMGGLMIGALLMMTTLRVANLRATLVIVLFYLGSYSLLAGAFNGLVTTQNLGLSLTMVPAMIIGIMLGACLFHPERDVLYRRVTLGLLIVLGLGGLFIR